MKLLALLGAGVLAAGTVTAAPAEAQHYGRGYHHGGYGYRHGGFGYRGGAGYRGGYGYGYRRHAYYGGGWRYRHHYARCRYRRCW